jgi:Fic family protein
MTCNWQQPDWPDFRYDLSSVEDALPAIAGHAGKVGGLLAGLPAGLETEAVLDLMISEAIQSSAIEGEISAAPRSAYYDALESAQRSNEITGWLVYFVETVRQAFLESEQQITFIVGKARFLDRNRDSLNTRQSKVIHRMLDAGPAGFTGGMNARKYIALTCVSKATATRDLQDLVEKGVLFPSGAGRSAGYELGL